MKENFVQGLFTLYCKLLCDCFTYLLTRNHFVITVQNNLEAHMKHLKLLEKWNWCLHDFSELWNLFSRVSMGNCFRCYFRRLYLSKCKKDCNIFLRLFWYEVFVLQKLKLVDFISDFLLNSSERKNVLRSFLCVLAGPLAGLNNRLRRIILRMRIACHSY